MRKKSRSVWGCKTDSSYCGVFGKRQLQGLVLSRIPKPEQMPSEHSVACLGWSRDYSTYYGVGTRRYLPVAATLFIDRMARILNVSHWLCTDMTTDLCPKCKFVCKNWSRLGFGNGKPNFHEWWALELAATSWEHRCSKVFSQGCCQLYAAILDYFHSPPFIGHVWQKISEMSPMRPNYAWEVGARWTNSINWAATPSKFNTIMSTLLGFF